MVAVLVAVVATALITAGLVLLWDDRGEDEGTAPTTTPTTAPEPTVTTPTTEPTTPSTTGGPTSTAVVPPVDASTAVYPYTTGSLRFTDPVSAARAFAVDFVGFTDPLVGELQQGDSRSGEVPVRPAAQGPVTTVFVRQLEDDTWWVLGAATDNITVDRPATGDAITSPVTVAGAALAFEGVVSVEVREDGRAQPIGTGVVTGGGGPAAPFLGEISFAEPATDHGALVFLTRSARDGEVWQAAVLRVRFG
ncbi:MAG TPA: Gmad2 immunoglobulin-like domain-containing protein [Acidimicrobiales bacterium]